MSDVNLDTVDWEKIRKFVEPKAPLFCPHKPFPKQSVFLRAENREVLFGGRASGGKSDALIMAATQYVDVPGYSALIIRNTFSDLDQEGAIMNRAVKWWRDYPEVKWSRQARKATFPSGATVTFGYLQHAGDELQYQGAEFQYIGFDELTQIREDSYKYLVYSRMRKPSMESGLPLARVPIRARAASNPAPNWVRQHFIVEGKDKGRLYIPSGIDDNPYVNREEYEASMANLNPVLRAQLAQGEWFVNDDGEFFSREDFKLVQPGEIPAQAYDQAVRYWDLAATEVSDSNRDPDWTVGALCAIVNGFLWILDIKRFRENPDKVEKIVKRTAQEDAFRINRYKIRMDQDPGQSGKSQISHYGRNVLLGYDFDGNPVTKDKEARVNLWRPKAKRGEVLLNGGGVWTTDFIDEACGFGGETLLHDDQMDAVSGAFETLTGINTKKRGSVKLIV